MTRLSGGCLCGAVRYDLEGTSDSIGYCHCTLCRRSSGAPVMAWATVARGQVRLAGAPTIFRSSSKGQRLFCPKCGTQVIFQESEASPTVDVNIVTLDDPTALRPDHHIWTSSRLDWFETDDDLPRFPGEPPTS